MKIYKLMSAALLLAGASGIASANIIEFANQYSNGANTSFSDGTFSHNLGPQNDGFYGLSNTSAFNGYGQNDEYITFYTPVTLNSLQIRDCQICSTPTTSVTVSLFNGNDFLTAQTIDPNASIYQTLIFNTAEVTKIQFDFAGGSVNHYGDGRTAAWYDVNNITYSAVPLPGAAFMFGPALVGLAGLARKRKLI